MKLHLPKALLAAVLAAVLAWPAEAFTSTTTAYPTGSTDQTTFNGDIWTWNNNGAKLSGSGSTYTKYSDTSVTYAGNATNTGGPTNFYNYFFNGRETNYLGNTLRFSGATENKTLTTDYETYVWVGGIIVESGNSGMYTLGRAAVTNFKLNGSGAVNMIINSDFRFLVGPDSSKTRFGSISIEKGGTWSIAKGKTLSLSANECTISFAENQTIDVTATGEGAGSAALQLLGTTTNSGTINIGKSVNMSVSGSLNNNGTLTVSGTYLGTSITNTGTINFEDGAEIGVSSVPTSISADKKSGRTSTQGSGFGILTGLDAADITALQAAAVTGAGTVQWGDVTWTYRDDYFIYSAATQTDLEYITQVTNSIYVGENVGVVKLANNVRQGVNVTVCSGSTWDINGMYNTMYTVTLDGGTLTNTGTSAIPVNKKQITGLTLTKDSFVSGSSNHYLTALYFGATEINLNGHTLTKTGTCTFYGVNTVIHGGGYLKIEDGVFYTGRENDEQSCTLGNADENQDTNIWLAGGKLAGPMLNFAREAEIKVHRTGGVTGVASTNINLNGHAVNLNAETADDKLIVSGNITGDGTLKISGLGKVELTGKVTLGASIENAGNLILGSTGSLTFTSKDVLSKNAISYIDSHTSQTGNGYAAGTFYIIEAAAGSSTEGVSKVVVGGKEYSIYTDGASVEIIGDDALKGLYYITLGGEFEYATNSTSNDAADDDTTGLVLETADTATTPLTLTLKTSLNAKATKDGGGEGVILRTNATINLDGENVSLDKVTFEQKTDPDGNILSTPTLKLTGTGLYKMDQATGVDAVATTTDANWSGKVKVSDTELGGKGDDKFYITALNNLGSNIEISGLSGYAYDGATGATATPPESPEVKANLVLKGTALTLTSAPLDADDNPGTLTFSGDLSGDGDIVNDSDGHVTLSGDISGWTGSYTASASTSLLTLAKDAKLNASVNGGSMELLGALTLGKTMSLTGDLTGALKITLDGAALDATKTAITVAGNVIGSGTLAFKVDSLDALKNSLRDGEEFILLSAGNINATYTGATLNGNDFFTEGEGENKVRYYIAKNDTSVTLSKVTLGLTWVGNETVGWTSMEGFGQTQSLTENSLVSFAGGGSNEVIVKETQSVKGVTVDFTPDADRDAYILSGEDVTTETLGIVHGNLEVQNKLTVNELTSIHTGTSLTIGDGNGSGSLSSKEMTNNGTLTIDSGSTVKVDSISGTGIVSGDGKLVVSGEISADIIAKNTGTIELEKLDKNVAANGVQGTLLVRESGTFTGNYNSATSIGTVRDGAVQELAADEKLTVVGTLGTVELTGLNSAYADSNKLDGIATTGASVKLNNKTTDDGKATTVTLGNASTMKDGVLDFIVSATEVNDKLKANDDKPTVTTGSSLSLENVTLKVREVENTGLNFNAGGKEKDILLFVLNDQDDCSVSNVTLDMSKCTWMTKYFTNFRVVQGSINVIADANTGYYVSHGGQTPNGTAGLALAGKAMFHLAPRATAPNGELAQVLTMLDNQIGSGNTGAMDNLGAALAGSSLSAVGLALADDVQRQLRSIRNRTTTMGVNQCEVNEDMPYVNGWISGDGNYRQLSESGTDSGYQVSSWGGTVGVDVDVNPNLTLGVAVSALFGDYTGKAADTLTGDLDTQYVSLFARVSTGSWVNTFVGTLGRADVDLERTIPGVTGKTTYKTNGMMFGFLYEVARTFALNDDATTCVQPLFNMSFSHTTLDSATEGGAADTRLTTDSASLTQFSLGLGGRLQSIVGENEYNRASIFEARALLKLDFGDRYNKLNTALAVLPTATVTTRSNEKGVIGAELGATLTIPLSQDAGSIFFDVNADFNADEVGVNGSVGYRVNF